MRDARKNEFEIMDTQRIVYVPQGGVCSKLMIFDVAEGIILNAQVFGGCQGNSQGICALLKGMQVDEAIKRLQGINCNGKGTSCPDQMSIALSRYKDENK